MTSLSTSGRKLQRKQSKMPPQKDLGRIQVVRRFVAPPIGGLLVELLNYLTGSKNVSARPSHPDAMTVTALEGIERKNCLRSLDLTVNRFFPSCLKQLIYKYYQCPLLLFGFKLPSELIATK